MGGLLIVAAIVVPSLIWGNLHSRSLWLALFATVWCCSTLTCCSRAIASRSCL
jgi:UDP-N-acetylmuramyl pentapeptide phosphotransferase/UDP-N-acetylglucosamine-1-phosphate transferase